jgi:peptidoglycan/xylan/chitin deacetylase (PgdA/CDA1 family)
MGAALAGLISLAVWLFFQITPGVIEHGSRAQAEIALTFDADMTPRMREELRTGAVEKWYDQRIVSTLEAESVPATFFFSGLWAETYPEVVRKLSETAMFEIGNHSYDHAAFSWPCYGLPHAHDKITEITKTQEILREITGKAAVLFRFPGGCFSATDLGLLYFMGLRAVGWDVISSDAFEEDGQKVFDHTIASTRNGPIIVMHLSGPPNAPMTAVVLPSLIKRLRERGFSFVTISRLLAKDEEPKRFTLSLSVIRQLVSARTQWTLLSAP